MAQRHGIDAWRLCIGEPHIVGWVVGQGMAHVVGEVDIIDLVGIEDDDTHGRPFDE